MVDKEVQPITPEIKEQEPITPDISPEKKDLTDLQTKVETSNLKTEIVDTTEINNKWAYELMKQSKMHDKLLSVLGSEDKVEKFALDIDKVVRKYLDQELEGFSNSIKNSMSVGIQFAMMETLVKQGSEGSAEFFTAFSKTKSGSASEAFQGLYKSFGKLGSANEFFILANKVQNITRYLSDKKNTITNSKNIPELMNPNQFKILLNKPVRSNKNQIDKLDIATVLTLNSSTTVDIHAGEDELKKIVNSDKIADVINEKTITAIQNSLTSADKLLDTREKFSDKATELVDKIAAFLNIDIPILGNLGELAGMNFPTDILGKKKDGGVMNFVLGVLGFRGGLSGLHKKYIQEKLDELHIDNAFVSSAYNDFQKNANTAITNDVPESTRKICGLSAPDVTKEALIKAKIPADYAGLKKSLVNSISSTTVLSPAIVQKFAPEAITVEGEKTVVDASKISDKEKFIDAYLQHIIPVLADPSEDFIASKKVDKDAFALAVMGGLVGDKYFVEGVNIGLINVSDFKTDQPVKTETPENPGNINTINGKIDFSKGNFSAEQTKNINLLIDGMNKLNITNPYTQIGILSVIGKESNFVSQGEVGYGTTPNSRIKQIFGDRVTKYSEAELDALKQNDERFFEAVYGKDVAKPWTGHTEYGDGYKYRGRGFNGLTFKANYKKYGELTGTNILNDPDSLNIPEIAAKVALAFFIKGKNIAEISNFTNKKDAAIFFADLNAGGIPRPGDHRDHSIAQSEKFDVVA